MEAQGHTPRMKKSAGHLLTFAAMNSYVPCGYGGIDCRRDWEPVLKLDLPPSPDVELLTRARQEILDYIAWVTDGNSLYFEQPAMPAEIRRAAERLIEVVSALPDAIRRRAEERLIDDNDAGQIEPQLDRDGTG
jgi:hypothetical protein